jgi:hypothetical protein
LLIDNNAASLFDFLMITAFLFKLQEVMKKVEVGFEGVENDKMSPEKQQKFGEAKDVSLELILAGNF